MRTTTTDCWSVSLFLLGLFFIFFYFIALPLHFLGLYRLYCISELLYRQQRWWTGGKLQRWACHLFCVCQVSSDGIVMCDQKTVNRVTWTATHRQRTYPPAHTADRRRTQTRDTYTYNKEKRPKTSRYDGVLTIIGIGNRRKVMVNLKTSSTTWN